MEGLGEAVRFVGDSLGLLLVQANVLISSASSAAILINGAELEHQEAILTDGDMLSVVGRKFRYFFRHPKEVKALRLEVGRLEEKLLAASALNVSLTARLTAKYARWPLS